MIKTIVFVDRSTGNVQRYERFDEFYLKEVPDAQELIHIITLNEATPRLVNERRWKVDKISGESVMEVELYLSRPVNSNRMRQA